MFGKRSELHIPDAAKKDSNAFEILRIWIAGGSQHVSLKTGVWEDPAAWGLMLADLAKHVANTSNIKAKREENMGNQRRARLRLSGPAERDEAAVNQFQPERDRTGSGNAS